MLVLGLGVYLFVEVRAQPAVQIERTSRPSHSAPVAQQTAAVAPVTVHEEPSRPTAGPAARPAAPRSTAPVIASAAAPGGTGGAAGVSAQDDLDAGPALDAVMGEANKAYDRGELEDAKTIASRVLAKFPTNVRMLRVMVSASCIDGDTQVAVAHYAKLPAGDQEQMRVRCARYGVSFPDRPMSP
jgi:hypothetical protein